MYIVDLHNFNCSLFSWTVVIRRAKRLEQRSKDSDSPA